MYSIAICNIESLKNHPNLATLRHKFVLNNLTSSFFFSLLQKLNNCNLCLPLQFVDLIKLSTNETFPICSSPINMHKYYATHYTIDRFQDQCLKKCTKFEYKGKFEATDRWHSNPRIVDIWYWLSSKKIKVYEEYLVYDTENVIGYIGGTLGLFIGFSFQNVLYGGLTFLENYLLQHVINDPTYQIRI